MSAFKRYHKISGDVKISYAVILDKFYVMYSVRGTGINELYVGDCQIKADTAWNKAIAAL